MDQLGTFIGMTILWLGVMFYLVRSAVLSALRQHDRERQVSDL